MLKLDLLETLADLEIIENWNRIETTAKATPEEKFNWCMENAGKFKPFGPVYFFEDARDATFFALKFGGSRDRNDRF